MKRRITSILVVMSMVFSTIPFFCMPVSAATKPSGSGTASDPYKISSVEELFWFRDEVNGINGHSAHPKICADLTANINLYGTGNWTPIGEFWGTFDGRNHTVSGVTITGTDIYTVGFFTLLEARAVIKNLHIEGNISGKYEVGGIVGRTNGKSTINNCSFKGTVTATQGAYGGITAVIQHGCTVKNCWVDGTIQSLSQTIEYYPNGGGIVGVASKDGDAQLITTSYCTATVISDHHGGGIVAAVDGYSSNQNDVTITNCWASGNVYAPYTSNRYTIGGILGTAMQSAIVGRNLYYNSTNSTAINLANFDDSQVSHKGNSFYQNFSLNRRTDGLHNDSAAIIDATQFSTQSTFENANWNFQNIWKMGADHPILQQSVAASSKSRNLVIYDDTTTGFNLPDYFDLILAENQNYNQDNRFTFKVLNPTTSSYETEYIDSDGVTVASISKDTLTLNGEIGVGTYGPFTIQATDSVSDGYGTFTMDDFYITVKHTVPKPQILMDSIEYGRYRTLYDFILNDGWSWVSPSICPKTDPDGDHYSYEAYYPFEEGKVDLYDLSALDKAGISYTTDTANNRFIVKLSPKVLESNETPQETFITVIDEDTLKPITGAVVATEYGDEFDSPGYNTTDASGISYGFLSPGYRYITVTKAGYETKTDTKQIQKGTNNVTIYLRPNRTTVKIPDVKELLSAEPLEEGEIPNALVSVTRISDTATKAWLGDSVSMTADAMAELELPPGDFAFRNATYGYSTDDVVFARVDALTQTVTFYSDSAFTPGTELTVTDHYTLHAQKMNDPTYTVELDHTDGTLTYTAKVSLSNVKANYGTFGIHYDSSIMSMTNVTYGADIDADSTEMKKLRISTARPGAAITAITFSSGTRRLMMKQRKPS